MSPVISQPLLSGTKVLRIRVGNFVSAVKGFDVQRSKPFADPAVRFQRLSTPLWSSIESEVLYV